MDTLHNIGFEVTPIPAALTLPTGSDAGKHEAVSNVPHGATVADGRDLKAARVLTVKLEFTKEQWRRVRELSRQSMAYGNLFLRGLWAQKAGLLAPTADSNESINVTQFVRRPNTGDLSGAVYAAVERMAYGRFTGDARRPIDEQIMRGAPLPQFRRGQSLAIGGIGVKLHRDSVGHYTARLMLQSKDCDGGCWMEFPVSHGTKQDDFLAPTLDQMANGSTQIRSAVLLVKIERYKLELRLCYFKKIHLAPMGARVATLGLPTADDQRLLLRTDTRTIDYTHKLHTLLEKKTHWDGLRRRLLKQVGRHRGSSRTKRELLAFNTFDDWCKAHLHQWSREVIDWCQSQGMGRVVVMVAGGDWPAYRLKEFLSYKGQEVGIEVVSADDASLQDASTERTAIAKVKKRARKAKQLGDALREVEHQLRA